MAKNPAEIKNRQNTCMNLEAIPRHEEIRWVINAATALQSAVNMVLQMGQAERINVKKS